MHSHFTSKFLDLKDCFVNNVSHGDSAIWITISTKPKPSICNACGSSTSKVHDYRKQIIKDVPILFKNTFIILKKRRYVCSCGKRFYESYSFLPKYHRMTNRLSSFIITELSKSVSMAHVADKANLSQTTVSRIFDFIQYPKPSSLPKVLAIDEFKGNTNREKYQCILVDLKKNAIFDILPDRKQTHLIDYLKTFSKHERLKVKFFVCDMWQPYAELAKIFLPNAKIIVDKYHFIRQVTWAVENVRKRVQKKYGCFT